MATPLSNYINHLGLVKEKVRALANIKKPRMNDLYNKDTAKPSPEEFYRIILSAHKLANLDDNEFLKSIDIVFPNRSKSSLLAEFNNLPAEIRFIKKYTLKQSDVENKIGMAQGKISRLTNEKVKDLLAVEMICFIEALNLDLLDSFKEMYGDIDIK